MPYTNLPHRFADAAELTGSLPISRSESRNPYGSGDDINNRGLEFGEPRLIEQEDRPQAELYYSSWYKWTSTVSGQVAVSLDAPGVVVIYTGSQLTNLNYITAARYIGGPYNDVHAVFTATAGVTYRIQVAGNSYLGAAEDFTLTIAQEGHHADDAFDNAAVITGNSITDTASLTVDPDEGYAWTERWYRWTAPGYWCDVTMDFSGSTVSEEYEYQLVWAAVWRGKPYIDSIGSVTDMSQGDNPDGTYRSKFRARPGETYYINAYFESYESQDVTMALSLSVAEYDWDWDLALDYVPVNRSFPPDYINGEWVFTGYDAWYEGPWPPTEFTFEGYRATDPNDDWELLASPHVIAGNYYNPSTDSLSAGRYYDVQTARDNPSATYTLQFRKTLGGPIQSTGTIYPYRGGQESVESLTYAGGRWIAVTQFYNYNYTSGRRLFHIDDIENGQWVAGAVLPEEWYSYVSFPYATITYANGRWIARAVNYGSVEWQGWIWSATNLNSGWTLRYTARDESGELAQSAVVVDPYGTLGYSDADGCYWATGAYLPEGANVYIWTSTDLETWTPAYNLSEATGATGPGGVMLRYLEGLYVLTTSAGGIHTSDNLFGPYGEPEVLFTSSLSYPAVLSEQYGWNAVSGADGDILITSTDGRVWVRGQGASSSTAGWD